ncbi:MAG: FMN-binding protein [Anaerotignaceae bacterium]
MPGAKFMVFKGKEILKTAVFAVLGLIIIFVALYFITGKITDKTALYVPGEYSSNIDLQNGSATVTVTVSKSKIKAVAFESDQSIVPVFYPLLETTTADIEALVLKEQSAHIDTEEQLSVTSTLVLNAIEKSLDEAKVK